MRILQVVPYFPPAYAFGGPGTVVYEVSKELAKRGHEVVVYTTDIKDLTSRLDIESPHFQDDLEIHYFKNFSIKLVRNMKLFFTPELFSKPSTGSFDIMHIHEYRTLQDICAHYISKKHSIPYVFQAHGSLPIMMDKKKLKRIYDLLFGYTLLKDASKVIALTPMEFQDYRNMNVPEEKIAVIPDGLNPKLFKELPSSFIFRRTFNIPDKSMIILFMGRVHKIKGLHYLIHAYAKLVKEIDNVILVVCGSNDGYMAEAKRLIASYQIIEKTRFVGLVQGMTKLSAYSAASVVVCPSLYGAFDLVPIETAFSGKPLIASNSKTYGLAKLIAEGNFGLLVNPSNSDELKNALFTLLKNQDMAAKLGSNGRVFATNNLTIERMVDKLEKLYREVC
jgi:glycosyltransferase involved in cell wall biosynthesis